MCTSNSIRKLTSPQPTPCRNTIGRVNDTPSLAAVSPNESSPTFETSGRSAIWGDGCLIQNEMLCMVVKTGRLTWQLHAAFATGMQAHTSVKKGNEGTELVPLTAKVIASIIQHKTCVSKRSHSLPRGCRCGVDGWELGLLQP